jgi:hypothetical protein
MSQPAVSRHLKVLERAGLIERSRHAQQRPCHLEVKPLMATNAWIEQYREIWEHMYRPLGQSPLWLQSGCARAAWTGLLMNPTRPSAANLAVIENGHS